MNRENEYQRSVVELAGTAKAIEEAWMKQSADNKNRVTEKPSFEINGGDYGGMGWMPSHPDFSCRNCARCNIQGGFAHERVVAGCRMNGDGYGSNIIYCKTCGFFCWTSYDEA